MSIKNSSKKVLFIVCVIIQITNWKASNVNRSIKVFQNGWLHFQRLAFPAQPAANSDFLQFESLKDFDRKNLDPFKKIWILQRKNFFKIYWNPINMTSYVGRPAADVASNGKFWMDFWASTIVFLDLSKHELIHPSVSKSMHKFLSLIWKKKNWRRREMCIDFARLYHFTLHIKES